MPVPAAVYPASLDSLTNPTTTTNRDDPGFELHAVIGRIQDILEALEAKVGIGASLPASGGGVLRQTASGTSAWGKAALADLNASGAAANTVLRTTDGTTLTWGTVAMAMLAAGAVSQTWQALALPTSPANQATTGVWYALPGSQLALTNLVSGSVAVYLFSIAIRHTAAAGRSQVRLVRTDTGALLGQPTPGISHATTGQYAWHVGAGSFTSPVTGSLTVGIEAYMVDAGTATIDTGTGSLTVFELRR